MSFSNFVVRKILILKIGLANEISFPIVNDNLCPYNASLNILKVTTESANAEEK